MGDGGMTIGGESRKDGSNDMDEALKEHLFVSLSDSIIMREWSELMLRSRLWLYFTNQCTFGVELYTSRYYTRLASTDPAHRPHPSLLNAIVRIENFPRVLAPQGYCFCVTKHVLVANIICVVPCR